MTQGGGKTKKQPNKGTHVDNRRFQQNRYAYDIEDKGFNSNNNAEDIILGNYGITDKYGDFYSVFDVYSTNYEIYNGIDYNSEDKITKLNDGMDIIYQLRTKRSHYYKYHKDLTLLYLDMVILVLVKHLLY